MASAVFVDRIGEQSALASMVRGAPAWAAAFDLAAVEQDKAAPEATAAEPAVAEAPAPAEPDAGAGTAPPASLSVAARTDAPPRVTFAPVRLGADAREDAATSPLSAYAPTEVAVDAPFALLLGEEEGAAAPPQDRPFGVSGNGRDHWWSDRPLPEDVTSEASLRCLSEAIYHEARSESETGQRAVAQVVINRVKNPAYPDDVCDVVYQNHSWQNRCQFTFACDGVKDVITDQAEWTAAKRIAREYAAEKTWLDEIGAATHYHNRAVTPTWAELMRKTEVIGHHVFYITKGGGWT